MSSCCLMNPRTKKNIGCKQKKIGKKTILILVRGSSLKLRRKRMKKKMRSLKMRISVQSRKNKRKKNLKKSSNSLRNNTVILLFLRFLDQYSRSNNCSLRIIRNHCLLMSSIVMIVPCLQYFVLNIIEKKLNKFRN